MFSKTSTFKNASQPAEKEADKAKPFFTSRQSPGTPFFSAVPSSVQPKLTINAPGDKYEQEADEMAERVVQAQSIQRQTLPADEEELMQAKPLEAATVQRKCAACEPEATLQRQSEPEEEELMQAKRQETATVQRQCAVCGPVATLQRQAEPEEEELMQAKPLMRASENGTATATPQLASQLNSSKGGGQPLPKDTLSSMNQAFGTDFSNVRVHTGSRAQEMSEGIQAKAFTHGSDIYFNRGQYNPGSTEGKRLLGHELTHVVQQSSEMNSLQRQPIDCDKSSITGVVDPARDPQQEVINAHILARENVRLALNQVENILTGGAVRTIIRNTFNRHFGNPSPLHIRRIRNRLRAASSRLNRSSQTILRCNRGGGCRRQGTHGTQLCPSGGERTRICPHFFETGPIERAVTIIHESIHAVGACNDIHIGDTNYPGSPSYNNAWSYDHFANMVSGVLGRIPLRGHEATSPPDLETQH
ncbi:MAG: DUF4157 domain-containing protein [Bacteroidetes bacterium]|jgi:hypothetical protein|nr:DUF4157 domain-containing protein [Bacteroidota bacterium]